MRFLTAVTKASSVDSGKKFLIFGISARGLIGAALTSVLFVFLLGMPNPGLALIGEFLGR
jgi:hypothetical protein